MVRIRHRLGTGNYKSAMISNKMQPWTKLGLEVSERTEKQYPVRVKCTIHYKSRCLMELQTSKEKAKE